MTPSISDYVHGLRRLWWVPVLGVLLGAVLSVVVLNGTSPSVTTTGYVQFTFRVANTGQDSDGSARNWEATVAKDRLAGYVQVVLSSERINTLLAARGIGTPPTTISTTTGQVIDDSAPVMIASTVGGVVEIRVDNAGLSQADATQVTREIETEVAKSVLAMDASQSAPSLNPSPTITDPQATAGSPSMLRLVLPIVLMLLVALALVYGIVWAQGQIWTSRDVEERLGAKLGGELAGRPADGLAVALAMTKGRAASTRVLLIPVGSVTAAELRSVGELIANSWKASGNPVSLRTDPATEAERSASLAAGGDDGGSRRLDLVLATEGLTADALREAVSANLVALVLSYGSGRYRELNAAGSALSKVTDVEIEVLALKRGSWLASV